MVPKSWTTQNAVKITKNPRIANVSRFFPDSIFLASPALVIRVNPAAMIMRRSPTPAKAKIKGNAFDTIALIDVGKLVNPLVIV